MDESLDEDLLAHILSPPPPQPAPPPPPPPRVDGMAANAEDELLIDEAAAILATEAIHDDEDMAVWGGSKVGKAPNKERNFEASYEKLVKDYFSGAASVYDEVDFERRHRVPRDVFTRVWDHLHGQGCFVQKYDEDEKCG